MSYDIELCDPVSHETLELDFPHQMRGGTYVLNDTKEAWLNVTFNYSGWYYRSGVFPDEKGIRSIYGKSGAESIPILQQAIHTLEAMDEDRSEEEIEEHEKHGATGYWMPPRKNAIKPLYQLLSMARMRPDGVWKGD